MKLNWGWRVAIVYSVFALSTGAFVAFAMRTNVELVRNDYYEYSLEQDKASEATALGAAEEANVHLEVGESGCTVTLPGSFAKATGTLILYRANDERLDRKAQLFNGFAAIGLDQLTKGHYRASIEWTLKGLDYRIDRAIEIQ